VKFYTIRLTANSCIALCSSRNAVSFSSARTTKRFPPHDAVIRVYSAAGNVIETHQHSSLSRPIRKVAIAGVTMALRLA